MAGYPGILPLRNTAVAVHDQWAQRRTPRERLRAGRAGLPIRLNRLQSYRAFSSRDDLSHFHRRL
jgi:hypothetical protein